MLTKVGKPTTTPSFQISCPPPKTLRLELVTKDYTITTSTSTSDEPPSIKEACARVRLHGRKMCGLRVESAGGTQKL